MKKPLILLLITLYTLQVIAQATVNVTTAGQFSTELKAKGDPNTITNLIVTGNINDADIFYMRDNMPKLSILDLENTVIKQNANNEANTLPHNSFKTKDLTTIKLPKTITSIGGYAFSNCYKLTGNLSIPESVTSIQSSAFYGCAELTGQLIIPSATTYIGYNAFGLCKKLNGSLTISSSVTYIGNGAFSDCQGIISIDVDENNTKYASVDGILMSKDKKTLIQCPAGKVATSYSIPNSVTSIADLAFDNCRKLTGTLIIPNSVTFIGNSAFRQCNGLSGELNIPNSVNTIGNYAFLYCSGLTRVIIPQMLTKIGLDAFYGCTNIAAFDVDDSNLNYSDVDGVLFNKDITTLIRYPEAKASESYIIPSSVSVIDYAAFRQNKKLKTIEIPASVKSIGEFVFQNSSLQHIIVAHTTPLNIPQNVFMNIPSTCKLTVPKGSENAYSQAEVWKNLTIISDSFVVSFDLQDGTSVTTSIVDENTTVTAPTNPAKANYTFEGWYKEPECINKWNFSTDKVDKDIVLYAKWSSSIGYVVSYNLQDGSPAATVIADKNAIITIPSNPNRANYSFDGWYKEPGCINKWDFASDKVTSDTILYAKWNELISAVETQTNSELTIYPNPVTNIVNISVDNNCLPATITLYSIEGKQLKKTESTSAKTTIGMEDLKRGNYILEIETAKEKVKRKIVKL